MKPGIIYRIPFKNINGDSIRIDISDTTTLIDDSADPDITTLKASGDPLHIVVENSDEDKLFPIRSKKLVTGFKSDGWQDIQTFKDGPDYKWKVQAYLNPDTDNETIFIGYLVSSELQQPYLSTPFIVVLTASDRLATLKDIPLTNDSGQYMRGKFRIAKILTDALKKTGLSLPLKVINNIRHGTGQLIAEANFATTDSLITTAVTGWFYVGQTFTITGTSSNNGTFTVAAVGQGIVTITQVNESLVNETGVTATFTDVTSTGHFYDTIYINPGTTYEKNIGEAEDCYTVLEKLLKEYCFLTQHKGEWWICSVDEYDGNPFYIAEFDANGILLSIGSGTTLPQEIGAPSAATYGRFINADGLVRTNRPGGTAKETYHYTSAKEAVCNMDFSRGDVITAPDLAAPESTGDYALDCWRVRKTSGTVSSTVFIRRTYLFGAEQERYAVVTPQSGSSTPYDFIESEGVEMEVKDKASVSLSFRFENNISGSGAYTYFLIKIYLKGDDGNWYYWWSTGDLDDPKTYRWTVSAIETDRAVAKTWNLGDVDEREWQSMTVEMGPLPVSGKLYIGLYQGKQGGDASDNQNIYYSGLSLSYKPFINGSYELFKGHINRIDRLETGYLSTRDEEVFIGDSPRKEFKGAMFIFGRGGIVFSGTVSFGTAGQFEISGDYRNTFLSGMQIIVTGSVSNNITGQITSVNYSIIGNTTTVFTDQVTTTELSIAVVIYEQAFTLTRRFYSAAVFALGYPPSYVNCHPYGYLQVFSVWNQMRNTLSKVSGSAKWIAGTNWPDLIHKYSLTDTEGNVANRYFLAISFDQDWRACQMSLVLMEIYRTDGKRYDDTFTFKYLTGKDE